MDPYLYLPYNILPKKDCQHYYKKYSSLINFKQFKKILDVGCGPGSISNDEILPLLSDNYEKFMGIDISKDMIQYANAILIYIFEIYANSHYKKDERIGFFEMDITTNTLPKCFQNEFDFITSNYTLHFVPDLFNAFKNIYDMLQPGGVLFALFLGKAQMFDVYQSLEKTEKFKEYLKDLKNSYPSTTYCDHPCKFVENILAKIGFKMAYCHSYQKNIVYDLNSYLGIMKVVNKFKMPKDVEDDFVFEHFNHAKNNNLVYLSDSGEELVNFPHTLLVVYGKKEFD